MKEYGIYIRRGSGKPYMIHFFSNIDSAKMKLYDMLSTESTADRSFFVDNDFFENTCHSNAKVTYYCIKERDISNWEIYSEEKLLSRSDSNIIYLQNYKNY